MTKDKLVKEDDNFIWFENSNGVGYVASKNAYWKLEYDNDTAKDKEASEST